MKTIKAPELNWERIEYSSEYFDNPHVKDVDYRSHYEIESWDGEIFIIWYIESYYDDQGSRLVGKYNSLERAIVMANKHRALMHKLPFKWYDRLDTLLWKREYNKL